MKNKLNNQAKEFYQKKYEWEKLVDVDEEIKLHLAKDNQILPEVLSKLKKLITFPSAHNYDTQNVFNQRNKQEYWLQSRDLASIIDAKKAAGEFNQVSDCVLLPTSNLENINVQACGIFALENSVILAKNDEVIAAKTFDADAKKIEKFRDEYGKIYAEQEIVHLVQDLVSDIKKDKEHDVFKDEKGALATILQDVNNCKIEVSRVADNQRGEDGDFLYQINLKNVTKPEEGIVDERVNQIKSLLQPLAIPGTPFKNEISTVRSGGIKSYDCIFYVPRNIIVDQQLTTLIEKNE